MKVLFVCLGNICRSPTAEGVMRALAGDCMEVDSAGASGWHDGNPPDARSVAAAAARGVDLSAQRSRKVVDADFERFDLIVAMDGSNLANLRDMAPTQGRAELVLLLDYLPDQPLRDVPDPYYGGPDGFKQVVDMIEGGADHWRDVLQSHMDLGGQSA